MASFCLVATLVLLASMLVNVESACAALAPNLFSANDNNKTTADIPATTATPEAIRADLKRKLDEAQALRDRLDNGANDTKAPDGIKPEEVSEQRRLIDSLIFFYQEGLNSLAATEAELEVFHNRIEEFWNYQYTLLNSRDPKLRQNALNQLELSPLRVYGSGGLIPKISSVWRSAKSRTNKPNSIA